MREDPPRDLGVGRIKLNRVQVGIGRHRPDGSKRAVAAVGPQLKSAAGLNSLDGAVEDLSLLIADVDQETVGSAEIVDDADGIVDVAWLRMGQDVVGERGFSPVADLPLACQVLHPHCHPQKRPPQKWYGLATNLVCGDRSSGYGTHPEDPSW